MKKTLMLSTIAMGLSLSAGAVFADDLTLIKNVNVFNGKKDALIQNQDVLVEGNVIKLIDDQIVAPENAKVIDGAGRTMTPGFIDAHTHLQWNLSIPEMIYSPVDYQAAIALVDAEATLMRGFTTIRDTGGTLFGVRRAINEGHFVGPRIYASGAAIGMTAGHGDIRAPSARPRQLGGPDWTEIEYAGISVNADGVPEVLAATRTQMRKGADFIKLFVGGAVTGLYDPLDVAEYSDEEIAAIVGEAKRWNTYAAVHSYTDASTRAALEAGAMTLEHVNLISEDTMKLAVKKGAYISPQTGLFLTPLPDSFTPAQKARHAQAAEGLDTLMNLAKKHKAKVMFGSDMVGDLAIKRQHLTEFTNRTKWFSNAEVLKQATSVNAEALAMSGPRNPYPEAKLGVIEEGAYADLLLINGNPLEDMELLLNPEDNLALIMKDGEIYKDITK